MSLSLLVQALLNGFGLAMAYVLVALGLTLIFSILEIINFAHGEFYMLGGFVAYLAFGLWGLPYLVALLSANPARVLGLPGGTLAPGSPADLTLLDLAKKRQVDATRFESRSRNTPFGGWILKGWPAMTIVGGRVAWKDAR